MTTRYDAIIIGGGPSGSTAAILLAAFPSPAAAESSAPPDAEHVLALVKEVQAQQAVIAGNETKINEKLVALAETIRVARIYSSRGGR